MNSTPGSSRHRSIAVEDQLAIVGATNIFVRQELEGRYVTSITDTLSSILGYPVQVQVVIGNHNDGGAAEEDIPRVNSNGNGSSARSTPSNDRRPSWLSLNCRRHAQQCSTRA